jgi:hypothetical protein
VKWLNFAPHGADCQCATRTTTDMLGLSWSDIVSLGRAGGRLPFRIKVVEIPSLLDSVDDDLRARVEARIDHLIASPCPYTTPAPPPPLSRLPPRPGASWDAWPDDWDGVNWQHLLNDGQVDRVSNLDTTLISALRATPPWEMHVASPLLGDLADHALASKPWQWAGSHLGPPSSVGRGQWSENDIVRALHIVRVRRREDGPNRADVARVALPTGASYADARELLDYLDLSDRGEVQPVDIVVRVLEAFPPGALRSLERRVAMLDAFESERPPLVIDPTEVQDAYEPTLDLAAFVELAPEDGQPDPISEVRKLLPGGSGVRGQPPIVYTPTALDLELIPELARRSPTLVVLSGNAGDGKTAFIESVLATAQAAFVPGKNEYEIDLEGRRYLVVLDGSEDAEDRSNEELLTDALSAFAGDDAIPDARGTLIAINKGRLLAYLERHQSRFSYLWTAARKKYVSGEEHGTPYILIDLNERSVVAPDLDGSLVGGVLEKLSNWSGWNACASCDAEADCPVLANVRALRRKSTQQQFWKVLAAVDLDDRVHVTARHLVTKVAATVVSDERCPDIRARVAAGDPVDRAAYLHNALFRGPGADGSVDQAVVDRVIEAYDPTDASSPRADREVAFHLVRSSMSDLVDKAPQPYADALAFAAQGLANKTVDDPIAPGELEYRSALIGVTRDVRRYLFVNDPGNAHAPDAAVHAFEAFRQLLDDPAQLALERELLLKSLNATLGIDHEFGDGLVVPRDYVRGLAGTGFALVLSHTRFSVSAGDSLGASFVSRAYLSAWARSIVVTAKDLTGNRVASLAIPMLMFEILMRAAEGFRPISQTERAYMVRLERFYRDLIAYNWAGQSKHILYENGTIVARGSFGPAGNVLGA